jgi:hypothetical protein
VKKTAKPMPMLVIVELGLDLTNVELLDKTRAAKTARETGAQHVVACITGFNDDPRELDAIPECRAFAQRCIDQGFIAYLDLVASASRQTNGSLGAAEFVWIAHGKRPSGVITAGMADEINTAIRTARVAAEAALGPYTPRKGGR